MEFVFGGNLPCPGRDEKQKGRTVAQARRASCQRGLTEHPVLRRNRCLKLKGITSIFDAD